MTYVTPPGPRIAYDQDGTIGFYHSNGGGYGVQEFTQAFLRFLNSDASNGAGVKHGQWVGWPTNVESSPPLNAWFALRFPIAMRLRALAVSLHWGNRFEMYRLTAIVETSSDSSNGMDGTWTPIHTHGNWEEFGGIFTSVNEVIPPGYAPFFHSRNSFPDAMTTFPEDIGPTTNYLRYAERVWRERRNDFDTKGSGWHPVNGDGTRQVMWVRVKVTGLGSVVANSSSTSTIAPSFKLHLYGEPDTTADDQRISFVTSGGAAKPFFDFGDIDHTDVLTQTFRVLNHSALLTAENIVLQILPQNPTSDVPAPDLWCKLSLDGVTWSDQLDLDPIAPGDTSDIITLRLDAQPGHLGPWSPRLQAVVEEWV